MQLRRILALTILAVLGGVISSAAAYDFNDVNATHTMPDAEETSSHVTDDESRIYGGREADVSKYPWTISLRRKPEGYTYCGGTLVTPQYIVTAAHCVNNTTMYAAIGAQASEGIQGGERIKIAEAWVHEKYSASMTDYDIAVMKLESPSTATTLPLPAADGSQNQPNTMAVVRGWGVTQTKEPAKTLLEVNVKIITNAQCSRSYKGITTRMLCAGAGGGKDTCQGDSGGALVANGALVGVVSWGGECGAAPGVYVRVTSVLDFINSKIAGGGEAPASAASQSSETTAT